MSQIGLAQGLCVQFDYQEGTDILLVWLGEPQAAWNRRLASGIYLRISQAEGRPVGLEVIACAQQFNRRPEQIDHAFAEELWKRYSSDDHTDPQ